MVGMGMTLTTSDFKRVASNPRTVAFGVLTQFTAMPAGALLSSKLFGLAPNLFLGLTLVGCSPGGTASNLVSLIAGADVALSVLMTASSTVLASILTPLLTRLICGSVIGERAGGALHSRAERRGTGGTKGFLDDTLLLTS